MNTARQGHRGGTFDVDFPLPQTTKSPEDVSHLVDAILRSIAAYADQGRHVSQSDVLQALSIATAVHVARADAMAKAGVDFSLKLLDVSVGSSRRKATQKKVS
jgi:hypothetical protein